MLEIILFELENSPKKKVESNESTSIPGLLSDWFVGETASEFMPIDGEDRLEAELRLYGKGSVCCGKASYWNDGAGQMSDELEFKASEDMPPERSIKESKS